MTEESLIEILDRHLGDTYYPTDAAISAMVEAVEKGSIGFANWIIMNRDKIQQETDNSLEWFYNSDNGWTWVTSDQLYQEYLKTL